MFNKKELITLQEAADFLGVHPETLRRWDREGRLRAIKIGKRGDRRYRREDIHYMTAGTNLNKTERWFLSNQIKILEKLYPEEAESYAWDREVLENGYEIHYPELAQHIYNDTMSVGECREVLDILDMFRALKFSYDKLEDKSGIERHKIEFMGFDGNDFTECKYLGYARFFCTSRGARYEELHRGDDFNSHMVTLGIYRDMLAEWALSEDKHKLSKEDIIRISGAKSNVGSI